MYTTVVSELAIMMNFGYYTHLLTELLVFK